MCRGITYTVALPHSRLGCQGQPLRLRPVIRGDGLRWDTLTITTPLYPIHTASGFCGRD